MWPLAVAVWLAPALALLPAALVVLGAVGPTLARLPAAGELPPGEVMLVLGEALAGTSGAIAFSGVAAAAAAWLWTVMWHAGVVDRAAAGVEPGTEGLLAILGAGVRRVGRFLRLAATAVLAGSLGLASVAVLAAAAARRAWLGGAESGAIVALVGGGILGLLWTLLCWAGVLRGAWILVDWRRRSGVLAWLGGVGASLRQPSGTALALAAWGVPAAALLLAPLLAGWWLVPLRSGMGGALVGAAAGLLRGFCWVALFMSFAPPVPQPAPGTAGPDRAPRHWFRGRHHPLPPGFGPATGRP
jgi:hypothetical protein